MKRLITVSLASLALGLPLAASLPVPADIRNPFEVPDPDAIRATSPTAAGGQKPARDPAVVARETAFNKVASTLAALEVKGVVRAPTGEVTTVLLGNHTVWPGFEFNSSDFGVKGIIKITAFTQTQIVIDVTIELETHKVFLPLPNNPTPVRR
jgi:hypothetical protein